jgi:LPS-assembly protein
VINAAYRYTNAQATSTNTPIRQIDLSTQWPLTSKWSAVGRYNYSIPDNKALETLAGFEYDGGCWAFRVVAHQFTTSASTQVTSFFMQLELNGLSKIGSNPLNVLRRNIGGYIRPEAPGVDTGDDAGYPTR